MQVMMMSIQQLRISEPSHFYAECANWSRTRNIAMLLNFGDAALQTPQNSEI